MDHIEAAIVAMSRLPAHQNFLATIAANHAAWDAKQKWEQDNVSPYLRKPHVSREEFLAQQGARV